MYGMFTYIYYKKLPNVAKKTAHMEHLDLAELGVFIGKFLENIAWVTDQPA